MQPKEEEKTVQRSLLKYNLLCTSTPWNISSKIVYKGYHIYAWSLQTILLNKNSRLPWDLNSDSWSRRRARWPFGQHRPGLNPVSIASLWLFLRCQNNWGRFQSGKEHSPASSMWHPSFRLDRMFALAKLGSNGHAKSGRFTDWIKIFLKWKVQGIFFKKNRPSRPLFQTNITIFTANKCEKIFIQYTVQGFEPMTFGIWVSSHNH